MEAGFLDFGRFFWGLDQFGTRTHIDFGQLPVYSGSEVNGELRVLVSGLKGRASVLGYVLV